MNKFVALIFLVQTLLFFPVSTVAKKRMGISWYPGTVESAFATAKKENKPIFLYWGAVWCPPCNHMKKKVFTTQIFKKEVSNFVAVYLDGDEKRAQVWGEKLGAKGYPTMLVLSPSGQEITRMPTGIGAKKYVGILEKARAQKATIPELMDKLMHKKLSTTQWDLLANYSWEQDNQLQKTYLSKEKKEATFFNLYQKSPEEFKSSFFLRYLDVKEKALTKAEKKEYRKVFKSILKIDSDFKSNFEQLAYNAGTFVRALRNDKKDHSIQGLYVQKMKTYRQQLEKQGTKNYETMLLTYLPRLSFFKVDQGKDFKVSEAFKKEVNTLVSTIQKNEQNPYARHSALTTAVWLLNSSQQPTLAKKLALKEIKTSKHAYYYMSYLSNIELGQKNNKSALEWSKKAWKKSIGHATRFEWGTSYLLKLIKHDEKNVKEIKVTFDSIIKEYKGESATFNGRSKRRFDRIRKSLKKWNEKHPKHKITI